MNDVKKSLLICPGSIKNTSIHLNDRKVIYYNEMNSQLIVTIGRNADETSVRMKSCNSNEKRNLELLVERCELAVRLYSES